VDMVPDGAGGHRCFEVWHSPEKSSGILPKLSLSNGLYYVYTYHLSPSGNYDFLFTAIDFADGKTRFSIPTAAAWNSPTSACRWPSAPTMPPTSARSGAWPKSPTGISPVESSALSRVKRRG